ncbi:hypothetical protein BGZ99_010031 [Dissophora globulifera]|uniref:Glucosidase 2 subunit beta n=1 Tax=Dissophora globulifera TaxID=979702 RepID=A0A9P6RV12_9FUNG|nr:hypothetical protein BGZ99_010031 [Dissophora globulifera]
MKATSVCLPLFATLALSVAVARAEAGQLPRGVAPSKAQLYTSDDSGRWKCLDGSKTIPFSAVNDDYCDCKDGSDEPGTSACGTGYFHCTNVGHIGSDIKSSRVNDGVCDPECCDGSDEYDGQIYCPNICEEVGAKAKEEQKRVRVIQEQGSRLRKQYIEHGKSVKSKMQEEIAQLKGKTEQLLKDTNDARDKLNEASEEVEKYYEGTKKERAAARWTQLAPLIKEQTRRLKFALYTKKKLFKTLKQLKDNYNKNYHDLAVKSAVAGFDDYLETLDKDTDADPPAASVEEGTADDTEISADDQFDKVTQDTNIVLREIGSLFELLAGMAEDYNIEYNDEAVLAAVTVTKDVERNWDQIGLEFKDDTELVVPEEESDETPEEKALKEASDKAQSDLNDAMAEEERVKDRIEDLTRKLETDLGSDETFAQLLDQCFDYKDIEYTYSVCLFGDANQRSQTTTFLGKFSTWVGDNYDTQLYSGGTKCWNGPDRSVKLVMSCGTENKILSVSEPEKCEYLFKLQTPAVCPILPDDDIEKEAAAPEKKGNTKNHDEL